MSRVRPLSVLAFGLFLGVVPSTSASAAPPPVPVTAITATPGDLTYWAHMSPTTATITGTVKLAANAPDGGRLVEGFGYVIPADGVDKKGRPKGGSKVRFSTTVPAGSTDGTFTTTINLGEIPAAAEAKKTSDPQVTIAVDGAPSITATIALHIRKVQTIVCNPTEIPAGNKTRCRVTLDSAAPPGGYPFDWDIASAATGAQVKRSTETVAAGATFVDLDLAAPGPAGQYIPRIEHFFLANPYGLPPSRGAVTGNPLTFK